MSNSNDINRRSIKNFLTDFTFQWCFVIFVVLFGSQILSAQVNSTVRFAVIGDYGSAGQTLTEVANLIKSWQPDFIITTGDNNYPDGTAATIDQNIGQYFQKFIFPYKGSYGSGGDQNRFFPSLGNHDWNTTGAAPYLDYFTLPNNERYYDFTWGPVHLFAIDSDSDEPDGNSSNSVQANWLKSRLQSSTSPWKIVYMHHPPYSSARHGSSTIMQWPFSEWGATAVLAGHDHTYERIVKNGIVYFVNGLGGRSIYSFKSTVSGSAVRFNQDYGAMLVEADSTRINFKFYTRQGQLIDDYTINSPVSAIQRPDARAIARGITLSQNFPNPFNSSTRIRFQLFKNQNVDLSVYSISGQKIRQLFIGDLTRGSYEFTWDGKNSHGGAVSSGIYFYVLKGESNKLTRKMYLIR